MPTIVKVAKAIAMVAQASASPKELRVLGLGVFFLVVDLCSAGIVCFAGARLRGAFLPARALFLLDGLRELMARPSLFLPFSLLSRVSRAKWFWQAHLEFLTAQQWVNHREGNLQAC